MTRFWATGNTRRSHCYEVVAHLYSAWGEGLYPGELVLQLVTIYSSEIWRSATVSLLASSVCKSTKAIFAALLVPRNLARTAGEEECAATVTLWDSPVRNRKDQRSLRTSDSWYRNAQKSVIIQG